MQQHSWAWERDLGLRVISLWNTAVLPTSPPPPTHDKQHLSAALFLKSPAGLSLEETQEPANPERTKGRLTDEKGSMCYLSN